MRLKKMGRCIAVSLAVLCALCGHSSAMLTSEKINLCETGTLAQIQQAIDCGTLSVTEKDGKGAIPLMFAAAKNPDPEVARALINAGSNVNYKDPDGFTALMCAAAHNENPEVVSVLIRAKADVDHMGENATGALFASVFNKNAQIMKTLLRAGADPNIYSEKEDCTPLYYAAMFGTSEKIKILTDAGANVNFRTKDGATPLYIAVAVDYQNSDMTDVMFQSEMLNDTDTDCSSARAGTNSAEKAAALIQAGANANDKDIYGVTALMGAARFNKSPDVINVLIQAGADVNGKDMDGSTALMIAAGFNSAEIVAALIKAGADVNDKNLDGVTALMRAAKRSKDPEVLLVLLRNGAKADAKNAFGKDAFGYAIENEHLRNTDAYRELDNARFK